MPSYNYKCAKCGAEQELIQKISEKKAPDCCDQPMETVLGTPAFILKGGCWAKDGYTKK